MCVSLSSRSIPVFTQDLREALSNMSFHNQKRRKCIAVFFPRGNTGHFCSHFISQMQSHGHTQLERVRKGIFHVPNGGGPECLPCRVRDCFSGFSRDLNYAQELTRERLTYGRVGEQQGSGRGMCKGLEVGRIIV